MHACVQYVSIIYIRVYTGMCAHVCVQYVSIIYVFASIHACVHICVCGVCPYMFVCLCAHVCAYVCVWCICVYVCRVNMWYAYGMCGKDVLCICICACTCGIHVPVCVFIHACAHSLVGYSLQGG